MAATPLILTLTVLTATVLILLNLWVFIRYTKDRRALARSQSAEPHLQSSQDTYAAENGESRLHLHSACQPSVAPHEQSHDAGLELQTVKHEEKEDDVDRAEIWLKRGASKDDLRVAAQEEDVIGTKFVRGWDMMGIPRTTGLESAGRR